MALTPLGEGRTGTPVPAATGHQHAPGQPGTVSPDPGAEARGTLAEQLAAAREAAARWPTLGVAQAQGRTRGDTFVAGTGAHWINYEDIDAGFDPAGFTGDADVWHQHKDVCIGPEGPLFAGDGPGRCESPADRSWMLHARVVPGWENPAGVFAMENTAV